MNKLNASLPLFLRRHVAHIVNAVSKIGSHPKDDEETRLNKTLIAGAAILFIPAGVVWSWGYFSIGLSNAALVPLAASFFLLVGLGYYALTRQYGAFRTFALLQTLLMPVALTILLGGFVNSGLVILWSALAPFAAMILENQRRAMQWFVAFLGLIALAGSIQNWIPLQQSLPEPFIRISFVMNLGSAFIITFVTAYYFVIQKEVYKARSEALLLNVLPRSIAETLKDRPSQIAEYHAEASVLFADIVGFTPLTASMQAAEVVDMLNEVFVAFDEILQEYHLEKIKTIGDSYMAAAGVPTPREDHSLILVHAAVAMMRYARGHLFHGRRLQFRIGIASGPLVAGVIGRRKFIYDLWGDTVNLASRMESHGLPGRIQMTRSVYDRVRPQIACQRRGMILVKGHGRVETFWVDDSLLNE